MTEEQILLQAERIYCWAGPKMGMTLFTAKLGRLALTNERLVFLSTGKSDAGKLMAKATIHPVLGMRSRAQLGPRSALRPVAG